MAPLLILRDVHLTYGTTPLLDGAEMSVEAGERLCLVGRNGSGKSTLLKIAAGLIAPDSGERFFQPGCTIRYLAQEPDFAGYSTLGNFVRAGLAPGDDAQRAEDLMREAGLSGEEKPHEVSGGEARRAALVRVLAPKPDILLLDEPTNHLDLPGIEWLENELASMRSALVLISHDRRFLSRLTHATLWLDRGRTRAFSQGFAHFEEWRDAELEQEEIDRHKLDRRIVAELDWLRHGVSGRRKRNQGRLGGLMALRRERSEQRRLAGDPKLEVSEAEASGTLVVKAFRASKSYGDRTVVKDFSFRLCKGNRVGVIGANGSGKTTLVNLLTGVIAPDTGSVRLGTNVEIARLDQDRGALRDDTTLAEVLTEGHGDSVIVDGKPRHVISYMKDFLFSAEQARQPVSVLSGGERARLLLAKALAAPSNLLVLDEPTNDLDLETLDLLQEMIADYEGTVLLVSHDRDFLDRTVTSVLMADGGGSFVEYAGGYSDMLAQRGEGIAAKAAAKPVARLAAAPRDRPSETKRRMTFKDKHALEELPKKIAQAEAEIAALQTALGDATLYARDPKRFTALSEKLSRTQADLAAHEDRWLALEMLRAEIEGA